MSTIAKFVFFTIQIIILFSIDFGTYMVAALMDYQGGIDRMIGIAIFQPIMGIILSIFVVTLCFIIGLPIRLIKSLLQLCTKFYLLFVIVFIVSLLAFLYIAFIYNRISIYIFCFSLFLFNFCGLHIFPPILYQKE